MIFPHPPFNDRMRIQMTVLSLKTAALTAVVALGFLMSSPAHAGVLRTSDGAVVTTKDGAEVIVESAGEECAPVLFDAAEEARLSNEKSVYFGFNSAELNRHAKRKLSHMARKLNVRAEQGRQASVVTVVGFADNMGNAAYNEKLALRRAKAVRDFLVKKGVKAKKIEARSLGKSEAKANCPASMTREQKIECSRTDRRVEVLISR